MNTVFSNENPKVFSTVGNGSYLYHFNIQEKEIPEQAEGKAWQYNEVTVWSPLSSDKVTKEVMNAIWDKDTEQKLLNDYNAAQLGILGEEYIMKYKDFLSSRNSIKNQIDKDFCIFFNACYPTKE